MEQAPRFKSVESALRFYYRAQEVLSSKPSLSLHREGQIPETGISRRDNLMFDFLTITACLKPLNQLQLWILKELYRPRKVTERTRIVIRTCQMGQRIFPRVRWTPQGVGRLKNQTLDQLESELAVRGLI